MHLAITGTRKGLTETQFNVIKQFITEDNTVTHFHEGDCIGVDQQVTLMFQNLRPEVTVICHPPERVRTRAFGECDEIKPARGYLQRDQDMVNDSIYLWVCPDGPEIIRSGTWTTVRYARKKGIPITIIMPNGIVIYEN